MKPQTLNPHARDPARVSSPPLAPFTLHPAPYALNAAPYTLNPTQHKYGAVVMDAGSYLWVTDADQVVFEENSEHGVFAGFTTRLCVVC